MAECMLLYLKRQMHLDRTMNVVVLVRFLSCLCLCVTLVCVQIIVGVSGCLSLTVLLPVLIKRWSAPLSSLSLC